MKYQIGFIGCGHMGAALAQAACKTVSPISIVLSNRTYEKAAALADMLNSNAAGNDTVAKESKYIFLGVKPQNIDEVLEEIRPVLESRKDRFIIVSMAAGVKTERIKKVLGNVPVIRIMPNTPVAIGAGTILYCCDTLVTEGDVSELVVSLGKAGHFYPIDENLMDAGASVSGCGPAFAYMFIDAIARGGEACGMQYSDALKYACTTVLGSAMMIMEGDESPEKLIDAVCSPGGSTIEGVKALRNGGFYELCANAVNSSFKRNTELGK